MTTAFDLHLAKISQIPSDQCWPWPTVPTGAGYCLTYKNRKRQLAHRAVYESLVGPIAPGMTLDHLCMNTICCNPDHLEPCSTGENSRRSSRTLVGANIRKTECPRGHLYDGDNLYFDQGKRKCRTCTRAKVHRWRAANPVTPHQHARRMELQRLRRAETKKMLAGLDS